MIDTPTILVDTGVLARNIERMARMSRETGVALRPHTKTHKIPEIARMQIEAGAAGVTVAKVGEAEVMVDGGLSDVFIAFPLASEAKIERALALTERARIVFAVDSLAVATMLSRAAARRGKTAEVRLEIDTGLRRTGVAREEARGLAAKIAKLDGLRVSGIFTFRGSLMNGSPTLDRRSAGLEEGKIMVDLAEALRGDGIEIAEVSVGSTPTAEFAATVPGVTEVRPGTYVFCDRMQVAYGVCGLEDCAATVLATVVSRPADDYLVVDGGSKTFAADVAPGRPPTNLSGFGEVVGFPEAVLVRMSEEHGILSVRPEHPFAVGDRLRIIPNHICTTVNLHNALWLTASPETAILGTPESLRSGAYRKLDVAGRGMLL